MDAPLPRRHEEGLLERNHFRKVVRPLPLVHLQSPWDTFGALQLLHVRRRRPPAGAEHFREIGRNGFERGVVAVLA